MGFRVNTVWLPLLAALATASPAPVSPYNVKTYTNTFESITAVPGVGTVTNLGVYNDLYWNFVAGDALKNKRAMESEVAATTSEVQSRDIPVVLGLVPHSPPNVLYFSLRSAVENGANEIRSSYSGSKTKFFDLYVPEYNGDTIYYGCNALSPASEASFPSSCSILVTGYDVQGKKKATQTLKFTAAGARQPLTGGKLGKQFVGLSRVTIAADTPPPFKNVEFDDVVTKVYLEK